MQYPGGVTLAAMHSGATELSFNSYAYACTTGRLGRSVQQRDA
jgi:hypothetical protein